MTLYQEVALGFKKAGDFCARPK